jgi:hypothetical protein
LGNKKSFPEVVIKEERVFLGTIWVREARTGERRAAKRERRRERMGEIPHSRPRKAAKERVGL